MARSKRSGMRLLILMALSLTFIVVLARSAPARADTGTAPWVPPTAVATGLSDAMWPSLAFTSDGVEHAAWETNRQIFYATQSPGQAWSTPRKIGSGISPVFVKDDRGQLHALFANQFMGNYEIYAITLEQGTWTLPVNISHTSGLSAFPTVIAGSGGTLYAAWMDNSPGYWTIYVGTWNGTYWSNQPIPNARGQGPALGLSPDGTLYLAWQDRVPTVDNPTGTYHIFFSQRDNGVWSLPIDVSDQPLAESIGVNLTTTADGLAHLTWIDDGQEVRYGFGRGSYWPAPATVTRTAGQARGSRILSAGSTRLVIVWDEGDMIRASSAPPTTSVWPKPAVITAPLATLRDVAVAIGPRNSVTVGWIQTTQPADVSVYESQQVPDLSPRAWLPIVLH